MWGDTVEEVYEKCNDILDLLLASAPGSKLKDFIKSVTFVGGSIFDNKELLKVDPGYLGNLNAQDADDKARLLGGNWKISSKGNDIYDQVKFGDIFTNSYVHGEGMKFITTDIAMKGSDKFVIYVWHGKKMIDFRIMEKSKGDEVIKEIRRYAFAHGVQESNILFDNDGVGQFVDGFIRNANEFKNGGKALNNEHSNYYKFRYYWSKIEMLIPNRSKY